jgi:hypothetical protein
MVSTKLLRGLAELMRADPECDGAAKMIDGVADEIDWLTGENSKLMQGQGITADGETYHRGSKVLGTIRNPMCMRLELRSAGLCSTSRSGLLTGTPARCERVSRCDRARDNVTRS